MKELMITIWTILCEVQDQQVYIIDELDINLFILQGVVKEANTSKIKKDEKEGVFVDGKTKGNENYQIKKWKMTHEKCWQLAYDANIMVDITKVIWSENKVAKELNMFEDEHM